MTILLIAMISAIVGVVMATSINYFRTIDTFYYVLAGGRILALIVGVAASTKN